VCGKRGSEPVERVPAAPDSNAETRGTEAQNTGTLTVETGDTVAETHIHSYSTFESGKLPSLGYFQVKIYGYPLAALVDSGSNRTLLGREGIKIIRALNLTTTTDRGVQIRTANGQIATIREEIRIPINLESQSQEITVALLPNLAVPCVLGIDFLIKFGIGLDFSSNEWYFAKIPYNRYRLATEPNRDEFSCCSLPQLTPEQEDRLENFLSTIPKPSENPGVTELTEHHINVGKSTPVKQRCYLVSPKVQEAIRDEVDKMLKAGIIEL